MPYIQNDKREPYDRIVSDFIRSCPRETWPGRMTALVFTVFKSLYGSASNTRYYKQNEAIGVLAAAMLELRRRCGDTLSGPKNLEDWQSIVPDVASFAQRVLELLPSDDGEQRPGHLNYLITELILAAGAAGTVDIHKEACDFIMGLAAEWYRQVTGPYEDAAIQKNGDTPGYRALCPL